MKQLVLVAAILSAPVFAQSVSVSDPAWTTNGTIRVEEHLGRNALRIGTGTAFYPPIRFQDGTVDFDLAMTPRRVFAGIRFRAQSDQEWEEIYLRAHKQGLPDAIQYAPAFAGARSNWQLYHGPGETATATFLTGAWMHVKLVVKGRRAAIFLAGSDVPAMVVPRLAHDPREGFIGFWTLDPSQPALEGLAASFSNLVIRPGVADFVFPEPPARGIPEGLITDWSISESFAPPDGPVTTLPAATLAGAWKKATPDPHGLVVLDRIAVRPAGVRSISTLARTTIQSDRARTAAFRFGASDDVSVFLNGTLLFSGTNGYSQNFPRREGLLNLDERTLYLPLRSGNNELILAVTERGIGGWGLVGAVQ